MDAKAPIIETRTQKKVAVVLFNLGGPDALKSVRPFLFNLFSDPAIISLPNPLRFMVATLISHKREEEAQDIYAQIGGKSPLLELTKKQAAALEASLKKKANATVRVFVSMRYWHPFSDAVAKEVKAFEPDEVLLVPLYPQYSTTTTDSSFKDWVQHARKIGLVAPTKKLCCYPIHEEFITAHAALVRAEYDRALEETSETPRVLFSAHGLPKNVIEKGDPYQWQVEQTTAAIVERMGIPGLDHVVCYQSRVGPLEWISPYTDEEIIRGAKRKQPLVLVPVAFVSDHSETLVELDLQYRQLAVDNGLEEAKYFRVPALNDHPFFITALTQMCEKMMARQTHLDSCAEKRLCPQDRTACAYHKHA